MSIQLAECDQQGSQVVMWCDTTGRAFGPVIPEVHGWHVSAAEIAFAFIKWLPRDARRYTADELEMLLWSHFVPSHRVNADGEIEPILDNGGDLRRAEAAYAPAPVTSTYTLNDEAGQ